jgi:nucleoside-diphosphate-sugar epimerase
MKRVLVTGASGFIGQHCLLPLLRDNYEVHATFWSGKAGQKDCLSAVQWHQVDLLDPQQLKGLLASIKPTHLLHLAWYAKPGNYWTSPENLNWVQGSLRLLQTFAEGGGQRAVIAGTCAEYDWNYGYCVENLTPLAPSTLYGACKYALQLIAHAFADQANLRVAWGHIFFLYGPHEYFNRLIPSVVRSLLASTPARCSHGNQVRDFLYVQDVADAFIALLNSEVTGSINIASGQPVALKEIIYRIAAHFSRPDLIQLGTIPASPGEPPLLVADTRRLRDEVKWQPNYNIELGLAQTIEWWRQNISEDELRYKK